jgi:hypothetical protein
VRGLLVGGLLACLLGTPALAVAAPGLAVEPSSFDFGEVRRQRTLSKEFRLVNLSDAELHLVRITTSCGCTVVETGARVVAPGESTLLRVELQTRDDSGRVLRTVLIESDDPERPRVLIELRATVVD